MGGCRYSKVISITSGVTQRREEETKVSCRRRRRKRGGGRRIDILLPSYQPESERCARDREIPEFLEGGRIDILLPSYQPESERCARDREIPEFFPFVSLSFRSYFVIYEGARAYATCWKSVGVKPKRGGQRAVGY